MKHHDLKMWSGHFQHVVNGDMKGDIRHTRDRAFYSGDAVTFHEGGVGTDGVFVSTGRTVSAVIGHVSSHGVLTDHVCLSLKRVGLLVVL